MAWLHFSQGLGEIQDPKVYRKQQQRQGHWARCPAVLTEELPKAEWAFPFINLSLYSFKMQRISES